MLSHIIICQNPEAIVGHFHISSRNSHDMKVTIQQGLNNVLRIHNMIAQEGNSKL